eukprot:3773650-Rhodomonas_salina.3
MVIRRLHTLSQYRTSHSTRVAQYWLALYRASHRTPRTGRRRVLRLAPYALSVPDTARRQIPHEARSSIRQAGTGHGVARA